MARGRLVVLLGLVASQPAADGAAVQLAITGAVAPALLDPGLGFVILFRGDKIVRFLVARDNPIALRLVLMGCLGGFERSDSWGW